MAKRREMIRNAASAVMGLLYFQHDEQKEEVIRTSGDFTRQMMRAATEGLTNEGRNFMDQHIIPQNMEL